MKKQFIKFLLTAATVAFICNCSEESVTSPGSGNSYIVEEPSWVYTEGNDTYIISTSGVVTDGNGNIIGNYVLVPNADGTPSGFVNIVALDGSIVKENVDCSILPVVTPPVVSNGLAWVMSVGDVIYVIYPNGIVTNAEGVQVGSFIFVTDPATGLNTTIGNIYGLDGALILEGVDVSLLKIMGSIDEPIIPASSNSGNIGIIDPAYSSSGDVIIFPEQSSNSVIPSQPIQSSSSVRSSSSAKSSSSAAKPSGFTIKPVAGGKTGSGFASRYWDCCKPHCAWPDRGGLKAIACDVQGNRIYDDGATSMCDGGNSGMCMSQIPMVVNDTLAFAFAATPGGENNCGKCFDLAFTGEGKYATDNHRALKGKHLIVMSNNIGYDVAGGQFDVMIPGGGNGIFDGCSSKMGWGPQGEQYGGLLSECEKSSGYKASTYKSCLTQKCNSSFGSDTKAKEGCLFLANWMNAAGNPLLNYREVECPKELLDKF